jgi:hypothetical protein
MVSLSATVTVSSSCSASSHRPPVDQAQTVPLFSLGVVAVHLEARATQGDAAAHGVVAREVKSARELGELGGVGLLGGGVVCGVGVDGVRGLMGKRVGVVREERVGVRVGALLQRRRTRRACART